MMGLPYWSCGICCASVGSSSSRGSPSSSVI